MVIAVCACCAGRGWRALLLPITCNLEYGKKGKKATWELPNTVNSELLMQAGTCPPWSYLMKSFPAARASVIAGCSR